MKEYFEELQQHRIPQNDGYRYVTTETIAIPIYRVTLCVAKRRTVTLELVEEMVLRFGAIGINDLDMIANSLGLPRDMLDITVGDLHVKNLASHSSGKCLIMAKGWEALKKLSVSEREVDYLHNVYLNAVNGEVYSEKDKYYSEGFVQNDTKMKHRIDPNSIENYRRNTSAIKMVFEQSSRANVDENLGVQDELVSIDSVNDVTVGFILAPIHIFVSADGYDVDVIAQNKGQKKLIAEHREIIIEQMRMGKLLSKLFVGESNNLGDYVTHESLPCNAQLKLSQQLYANKDSDEFYEKALEMLLRPRRLFDNELLCLCKFLFLEAKIIVIQVDDIGFWSRNSKFLTIGSFVSPRTQCKVVFQRSRGDVKYNRDRIHASCPNIPIDYIQQGDHSAWLCIMIDSKYKIDVHCDPIPVFSNIRFIPYIVADLLLLD